MNTHQDDPRRSRANLRSVDERETIVAANDDPACAVREACLGDGNGVGEGRHRGRVLHARRSLDELDT
jgi:hypothetical protein